MAKRIRRLFSVGFKLEAAQLVLDQRLEALSLI